MRVTEGIKEKKAHAEFRSLWHLPKCLSLQCLALIYVCTYVCVCMCISKGHFVLHFSCIFKGENGRAAGHLGALCDRLLNKHANYCAIFDYDFSTRANNIAALLHICICKSSHYAIHQPCNTQHHPAPQYAQWFRPAIFLHAFNTQRLFCIQILLLLYWIGAATMATDSHFCVCFVWFFATLVWRTFFFCVSGIMLNENLCNF